MLHDSTHYIDLFHRILCVKEVQEYCQLVLSILCMIYSVHDLVCYVIALDEYFKLKKKSSLIGRL